MDLIIAGTPPGLPDRDPAGSRMRQRPRGACLMNAVGRCHVELAAAAYAVSPFVRMPQFVPY